LLLQTNLTTASQQAVYNQGQSGYAVQQGQTLVPPGSGYAPLGGNSGGTPSYQSPPRQPAPQQPQPVAPQGGKKLGAGGQVNPRLQQIATASCVQCHDGTKPDRLDLRDLSALDVGERAWALALVEDGTMPKGAEPLNDEAVKLWRAHLTQAHQATKMARK
jgi:mono/diheme cytochrome c family protein